MKKRSDHILNELLARKYQSGEKEALKELIRRFNPVLESKIYYHTRNRDSVKDISQECWYVIINDLKEITFQIGFEAWAFNIARNKAIDWIRHQQRGRKNKAAVDTELKQSIQEGENELRQIQLTELKLSLKMLPQPQQIILELFYKENLTLNEIAEVLAISKGTVKSRLFNAREQLKKIIR